MISICIASRGPSLGLWATCVAAHDSLRGIEHEFCLCINGREKTEADCLLERDLAARVYHGKIGLPPPIARDNAAEFARGSILVFMDDHVLPSGDSLAMLAAGVHAGLDVLHAPYSPRPNFEEYYHYILDESLVKGDYSKVPPWNNNPYMAAAGSSGCFAISRDAWEKSGGYGDWFEGFGGEEPFFDLKCWLLGLEVWVDPRLLFYHFSVRQREYDRTKNPRNWELARGVLDAISPLDELVARLRARHISC